jgi:hypothetical protein
MEKRGRRQRMWIVWESSHIAYIECGARKRCSDMKMNVGGSGDGEVFALKWV